MLFAVVKLLVVMAVSHYIVKQFATVTLSVINFLLCSLLFLCTLCYSKVLNTNKQILS